MKEITLVFSGAKTYWLLHEYLKQSFELPNYYGRNLDALWDCLYCCYDRNTTIRLKNLSKIPGELDEEVRLLLELFRDLNAEDGVVILVEDEEEADLSGYLI